MSKALPNYKHIDDDPFFTEKKCTSFWQVWCVIYGCVYEPVTLGYSHLSPKWLARHEHPYLKLLSDAGYLKWSKKHEQYEAMKPPTLKWIWEHRPHIPDFEDTKTFAYLNVVVKGLRSQCQKGNHRNEIEEVFFGVRNFVQLLPKKSWSKQVIELIEELEEVANF